MAAFWLGAALALLAWSPALPPVAAATRAITASVVPAGPFPKTVRGPLGDAVEIPATPRRIVSIALSADETLVDLVPPERLVGVTTFIDDPSIPPASGRVPAAAVRVTGEPEALLALRPDIVFASAYTRPDALAILAGAGVPVVGSGALRTLDAASPR